ncbi:indolepyruvate oxidoreductase subunit beta family protein [Novosphingobium cyanobacteriorum]|uniref:Indolepyruvate oxidoreductase subunit beta family protein n=1 Tax=Novosphingobium cyanobacteriorum TaxID=3024215 RepID=A0ABT6CJP1_9SPHN|nr:indolepyruvate oxidoreductase subunit beta family protein [Novosphingobium cyanobacteriorum]MDF8333754.1 indolepyruvate oxidoreductase subunit beta family protein [Novosphingobium cyanobacteriorum]
MLRDETVRLAIAPAGEATERPISIAIVAMGGQGGGVLTGWVVRLAEDAGWVAQSTSVPGVAQRTGATIYYVEMMPAQDGLKPILAQMPTPGDVDIVIASEFMEAGRSILRGIVTPERTTLIASDHRALAISEKSAPGLGIADSSAVNDATGVTARRLVVFDMDALATANGSVISAAMFGALAGSGALPFPREAYHAVISAEGKGVAASLRTFDAAFDRAQGREEPQVPAVAEKPAEMAPTGRMPRFADARMEGLARRVEAMGLPQRVTEMALHGLAKVVDFQDVAYGAEYLARLQGLLELDRSLKGAGRDHELTFQAAKYLANAMVYDDIVRVADLKTRAQRRKRIAGEIGVGEDQILQTTEYMHPRLEELAGILPARLARWLQSKAGFYGWLDRRIDKGRRVRTYSIGWFVVLYVVGGLRGWRRASLRHQTETAHIADWLVRVSEAAHKDYELGVEVLKCRRLIKGYSDTHDRGKSKFTRVLDTIGKLNGREDAVQWARRLRETAIRDGEGRDLDGLIRTIGSFS